MFVTKVLTALLFLGVLSIAVPSAASSHSLVLHEKRSGLPQHWQKRSRAYSDFILPVRIGLRQQNLEHAERYLLDVSDPSSANFGVHHISF